MIPILPTPSLHAAGRRGAGLIAGTLACVLCVACGEAGHEADVGFTTRDSAGTHIAFSARPAWDEGEGWRLGEIPSVEIGLAEGEDPYLFVSILSAFRLEDGRIVVAEGRPPEIRVFDADGVHVRSMGGSGEGPGEFSNLTNAWAAPGDSAIIASDWRLARTTVFGLDGDIREVLPIPQPVIGSPLMNVVGQLESGDFLGIVGTSTFPEAETNVGRTTRDTSEIIVFDRDGNQRRTRPLPGRSRWIRMRANGQAIHYPFLPFTPGAAWGHRGTLVYTAVADEPEIVVLQSDGSVASVVRWPAERRQVTDAIRAEYVDGYVESVDDPAERRKWLQDFDDIEFPDRMPYFEDLMVGRDGDIWVERYRYGLPPDAPSTWDVFAPNGRWLGGVDVPPDLTLHDIDSDHIIAEHRDSLGVRRIRVLGLDKGTRGRR